MRYRANLYEHLVQVLEFGQTVYRLRIDGSSKFFFLFKSLKYRNKSLKKVILNSALNFRRVTYLWLKLETQVSDNGHYNQSKDLESRNIQSS